jgi:toxin ParE1/3/4
VEEASGVPSTKPPTALGLEQLAYIAADNVQAAIRLDEEIERQVDLVAEYPMGREGRVKGTRELVITRSPFIAIYRTKGNRIEILRILHGAQQWPKRETGIEVSS